MNGYLKQLVGITLSALVAMGALSGIAYAQPHPQDEPQAAHLVLALDGDIAAIEFNRYTWEDLNAYNQVLPGMSFLPRDYFRVSGSSNITILCADLSTTTLFSNGVAECDDAPDNPAFLLMDAVDWSADDVTIMVRDGSTAPEGSADDLDTDELDDDTAELVSDAESTINGLGLDDGMTAYALANLYASYGLYFDAINTLQGHEDLQCTEQRPLVQLDDDLGIFTAPTVYIRMGEWWAVMGDTEASQRYFQCALETAETYEDTVSAGLATARWAGITEDAEDRTTLYQASINYFATLSATANVDELLDLCGSSNCTRP